MDFDTIVNIAMHDMGIPEDERSIVEEDLEDFLGWQD